MTKSNIAESFKETSDRMLEAQRQALHHFADLAGQRVSPETVKQALLEMQEVASIIADTQSASLEATRAMIARNAKMLDDLQGSFEV